VVLGEQSSGKSSVLESIAGREVLPRGSGIVTRCPLVMQLRKIEKGNDYCEFSHRNGPIHDWDEARKEIENRTAVIAGGGKDVIDQAIAMTIFSPNVVDLTLVDLPGLVNV